MSQNERKLAFAVLPNTVRQYWANYSDPNQL